MLSQREKRRAKKNNFFPAKFLFTGPIWYCFESVAKVTPSEQKIYREARRNGARGSDCLALSAFMSVITEKLRFSRYSRTPIIQTRLFRIPRYFELKTISLGFSLQLFTIGYFELPLFRTIFRLPFEFEISGFECIVITTISFISVQALRNKIKLFVNNASEPRNSQLPVN